MNNLLVAAVKLYHKKEREAFEDIHTILCLGEEPPKRKGHNAHMLWSWGLSRWGKAWTEMEYSLGLGAKDKS